MKRRAPREESPFDVNRDWRAFTSEVEDAAVPLCIDSAGDVHGSKRNTITFVGFGARACRGTVGLRPGCREVAKNKMHQSSSQVGVVERKDAPVHINANAGAARRSCGPILAPETAGGLGVHKACNT